MIYTDVRLKIPSPVPFCTFYRCENRASLTSHPIGPKCACRYFFLAFFCLNSLCDFIHVKNERRWPLGVYMRKRTSTRVPCRGELLIYYCVYTFTSFLLITCPSWRRYLGLTPVHYPLQSRRRPIWYGNERSFFVYWYRLRDLAPGWNSTYCTATGMNSRRYDSFW